MHNFAKTKTTWNSECINWNLNYGQKNKEQLEKRAWEVERDCLLKKQNELETKLHTAEVTIRQLEKDKEDRKRSHEAENSRILQMPKQLETNLYLGHEAPKKLQQALISPSLVKQMRYNILQKIKPFRFPNVSITNCIFENEYVEFYFVLEGIPSIDESLLVSAVVTCLGVDASFAERIRVTQLKCKPTGERTHFGPGNPILNINARSMTTLGAFVSIGGKGDHVLSCGHDKTVGDILSNDNNERIGAICAVACCVEDGQSYDAALANVDNIDYTKSVAYEGRQLHLAPTPVDPVKGTVVQRFPPRSYASQAIIRHTDYNSFLHNIYGCFSVITDNRETFHRPGESGLVVTSVPSAELPDRVDPIGMLFFREFVEKNDDGRGYFLSLAIPVTKNLEKLQEHEYCGRKQITF